MKIMKIELLKVTVSEIKLSLSSSLNDHTESYTTVLTERGGSVATAVRGAGNRLDTDTSTSRTAAAAREAGEDMAMKAVLLQLIDAAAFNLAFLTVTEITAVSQRHLLLTRKHQNKSLIVFQE
ncbi:hypothetical protein BDFG_09048 [Blastomyces dermatitidis ATCC 26199]|nr:hypothetical protein BDFG_09048 [Blastomyces dermatitidis ATCC 26199]